MSAAETEAMIDAGKERCHACGFYDAPRKMLFNCDGSRWFCATVADGEPPCAKEETPCIDCSRPTVNLDLDMDGACGCVADAAESLRRVQVMGGAAGGEGSMSAQLWREAPTSIRKVKDVPRENGIRLYCLQAGASWNLQVRGPVRLDDGRQGKDYIVATATASVDDLLALREAIDGFLRAAGRLP